MVRRHNLAVKVHFGWPNVWTKMSRVSGGVDLCPMNSVGNSLVTNPPLPGSFQALPTALNSTSGYDVVLHRQIYYATLALPSPVAGSSFVIELK
jgi:hypothetical protein